MWLLRAVGGLRVLWILWLKVSGLVAAGFRSSRWRSAWGLGVFRVWHLGVCFVGPIWQAHDPGHVAHPLQRPKPTKWVDTC